MLDPGRDMGKSGSIGRKKGPYTTDAAVTLRAGMIVTAAMLMAAILHVHGLAAGYPFRLHRGYPQHEAKTKQDDSDTAAH